MTTLIKNVPFKVAMCCVLIITFGSCATIRRVPESEYAEIDKNQTEEYFITFKDGTKHAARRISISDTTLTIYEARHLNYTGYTDIKSDELPYIIDLDKIESVRMSKTSLLLSGFGSVVIVAVLGLIWIGHSLDEQFGSGD